MRATHEPRRGMTRRSGLAALALIGALLLIIAVAASARAADSSVAAWCWDGDEWLGYAGGIPGSASPEQFTQCLRAAAERDEVTAISGELVEGGTLLDLGDTSLYWALPGVFGVAMTLVAYDDHVIIHDNCDRVFELRAHVATMVDPGYPCVDAPDNEKERIREDPRDVTDPDFTIFIVERQLVVDGADGWYHIVRDITGYHEDPTPRSTVTFSPTGGGIWVTAAQKVVPNEGHFDIHEPVAGTRGDEQQFRAYNWEERVTNSLFPPSFNETAYYALPDQDAYWAEVRGWLAAMSDDLYRSPDAVRLDVLDVLGWEAYATEGTVHTSLASANTILHEFAHTVAGVEHGHDGRFVATLLMIWERYVPGFDAARARELASLYSVNVGEPADVEPESGKTRLVHELFAKAAPVQPSDDTPIPPDQLLGSVRLSVGNQDLGNPQRTIEILVEGATCDVTSSYPDGTTDQRRFGPAGEFTINPEGDWNGLSIGHIEDGVFVDGTPTAPGRVRVEVTTACPSGNYDEARVIGYAEVIVVDSAPTP